MKIQSFLNNINYKEDKPAITVMLETESSKEIRISFKENQFMKDHKAPFPITVQVLKGIIDFGVNSKIETLNTGDLISLNANVVHNLKAKEDSVVRLTLSKFDTVNRVKQV